MKSDATIRKAKRLWQTGQPGQAYAVLNDFVGKNPKNAAVRSALIDSLLSKANDGAALQVLADGIRFNPSNTTFQQRFVSLVRSMKISPPDTVSLEQRKVFVSSIGEAVGRALSENWGPVNGLAKPACDLVVADPDRTPLPSLGDFETLSHGDAAAFLVSPAVKGYIGNSLLRLVMRHALVVRPEIELALGAIRRCVLRVVLEDVDAPPFDDDWVFFLSDLSLNAFQSEYALYQQDGEEEAVAEIAARVAGDPQTFLGHPNIVLPVLAAYRPLHQLFKGAVSLAEPGPEPCSEFSTLWREQVVEPRREAAIRDGIETIGATVSAVSRDVQKQYEENPYPRWRHPDIESAPVSLRDFLHRQFPGLEEDHLPDGGALGVLIAGCGTGSHPIHTASRFRDADITAMDLSFTSLAHAVRKTEELGISSIRYVQGDLLQCDQIGRQFDLVESVGVLHHLEEPEAGLRKLVEVLKPGGFMRLALYSRTARSYIRAGRAFVAKHGYDFGIAGIRRCRADLIAQQGKDPAAEIVKDFDFFSASGCRDLIMHVQEHQYDLSELRDLIAANGMELLGFANFPHRRRQAYLQRFPADTNLSNWETLAKFEVENPDTFSGMYGFWLRKPKE